MRRAPGSGTREQLARAARAGGSRVSITSTSVRPRSAAGRCSTRSAPPAAGSPPARRAPGGAASQPLDRVELLPQPRQPRPLRVGVQRPAQRAAQLHADPRAWGADRPRSTGTRTAAAGSPPPSAPTWTSTAHARHGPEVRDDLGDPPLPQAPGLLRPRCLRGTRSRRAVRSEATRSSSAAPWWPTSWMSEEAMALPIIRSRGTRMMRRRALPAARAAACARDGWPPRVRGPGSR